MREILLQNTISSIVHVARDLEPTLVIVIVNWIISPSYVTCQSVL